MDNFCKDRLIQLGMILGVSIGVSFVFSIFVLLMLVSFIAK